jgi:hypothetical protein
MLIVQLAITTIQLAMLIVWLALRRKSDQPEDGSWLEPKHVVERGKVRTSY